MDPLASEQQLFRYKWCYRFSIVPDVIAQLILAVPASYVLLFIALSGAAILADFSRLIQL